ncbi:DNA-binding protein [Trinickia fusca]|uniref:DNA-binding protein n=1 Tax=Trinickia fusca TaxID=2419777 RepID=A0A494XLG9_9BURK|nr:DNA-binding protein [Trinickia fusca]RKP48393.1 DNA-binding protein [Trinickia fusca]
MTLDEQREAIRHELEALRANGAHRRELSLHACKRLFFDLGIRPSMAAVRELTQTGSASDIPKDIDHFWERIRDASKIRVGAGAIPKVLEEKAGELLGALFEHALVQARESVASERSQIQAVLDEAEQRVREAQIRHEASEQALQRSEAYAQAGWARVRELETGAATATMQHTTGHDVLHSVMRRLETENEKLAQRLEVEQATNASLRERIDALHGEMQQNAEHYAAQIKDAVAEAERRVKPMLVELDSLRSMASTYQTGIRDASRKEFDFIQQLSTAKSKADRLEDQVRSQSDEIDALTRELDRTRGQSTIAPELAQLLRALADEGRLGEQAFAMLGTLVDGQVAIPLHCPKCDDGEPELSNVDGRYELLCPECEHSSGMGHSRFEVVTRFLSTARASSV